MGRTKKTKQKITSSQSMLSYELPWRIYSIGFSNNPFYSMRLGIGSLLPQTKNYVRILHLNKQGKLQTKIQFEHRHPANKILFIPDVSGTSPDIFATSGQSLRLYQIKNNQEVQLKLNINNILPSKKQQNQFYYPFTSFDWNPCQLNKIVTSSIDACCAAWDIQTQKIQIKFYAYENQIFDISCSTDGNTIAACGADGFIKIFDIRDIRNTSLVYCSQNNHPIVKLAWNTKQVSSYIIAAVQMCQNYVSLTDIRKSQKQYGRLKCHQDNINGVAWAPKTNEICTIADDGMVFIWDINMQKPEIYRQPKLQTKTSGTISNLAWSKLYNQWIALCLQQRLQISRV